MANENRIVAYVMDGGLGLTPTNTLDVESETALEVVISICGVIIPVTRFELFVNVAFLALITVDDKRVYTERQQKKVRNTESDESEPLEIDSEKRRNKKRCTYPCT